MINQMDCPKCEADMIEIKEKHMRGLVELIEEEARGTGQVGEQFLAQLKGGMNTSLERSSFWICPECGTFAMIQEG